MLGSVGDGRAGAPETLAGDPKQLRAEGLLGFVELIEGVSWSWPEDSEAKGIGGGIEENLQRNSRAGFTVVVPFQRRHGVRASYSTGVSTRSGSDFEIFSLSYLYAW